MGLQQRCSRSLGFQLTEAGPCLTRANTPRPIGTLLHRVYLLDKPLAALLDTLASLGRARLYVPGPDTLTLCQPEGK